MKKTLSLAVAFTALFAFAKTSTPEGWLDDYDAALKKAADENKHIVIDFSGSDWCGWCKRLDKEVFTTDAFKKAAAEKYVLLMVDSPMKKSLLTEKAAKENPKLVEKFGVKGFPTVVVLDPKGEEVCRLGYEKGGPEKYIEKLGAEIRDAPDVKKYIKPIEDVLNFHDKQMAEDSRAAMDKVEKKFPKPDKELSKAELRKFRREAMKYAQQVMFEEVYAKYVPLYDKAFA
ncbi:MAG: thioredoxin family protein, partial [Kiritimatiellae bacterium]|nr:thioredoxin family protein [Kiritimatiellia bacterium]